MLEVWKLPWKAWNSWKRILGRICRRFFYAMLAPLTLFGSLSVVNFPSAGILLICVPMIPVTIVMIQKWAKKLLSKYWGQYTALGDTFFENLQGLTTTKIYEAVTRASGNRTSRVRDFVRLR